LHSSKYTIRCLTFDNEIVNLATCRAAPVFKISRGSSVSCTFQPCHSTLHLKVENHADTSLENNVASFIGTQKKLCEILSPEVKLTSAQTNFPNRRQSHNKLKRACIALKRCMSASRHSSTPHQIEPVLRAEAVEINYSRLHKKIRTILNCRALDCMHSVLWRSLGR
ncbi:hypothetical protein SARC_09391, partial [Sphaeroforma arctica JP610]